MENQSCLNIKVWFLVLGENDFRFEKVPTAYEG